MKSRTEILVPLAAIQAVPIAVIAWYRLHRYAWYRYSAIVIYLTPLFEQASKWAVRIKTIRRAEQAIVNTFEFTLPQDCKVKRFDAYDKEWLDFIVDSRKGKQPWSGYDIIEGGVADDRVIDAVEAYINGYADVEHTLRQLVYHKPNYQICILSQEIVDKYLQFKSYERI